MRRLCVIAVLATALSAPLLAQQAPPPPPATQAPQGGQPTTQPPPAPPTRGQQAGQRGGRTGQPPTQPPSQPTGQRGPNWQAPSQNIRIEVTITDSAEKTTKKVVSMLVADGNMGRIRSQGQGVLNVDGQGQAAADGRIYLSITIEYMPDRSANVTNLNQSISLVLVAGKPTLISQSADPGTDRKVTVEVTATVVK